MRQRSQSALVSAGSRSWVEIDVRSVLQRADHVFDMLFCSGRIWRDEIPEEAHSSVPAPFWCAR